MQPRISQESSTSNTGKNYDKEHNMDTFFNSNRNQDTEEWRNSAHKSDGSTGHSVDSGTNNFNQENQFSGTVNFV